ISCKDKVDRILNVFDYGLDCFTISYFISYKNKEANGIFRIVVRGLNYFLSSKSSQVFVEIKSEILIISFVVSFFFGIFG
ncbi:hypothetical protein, partial [Helicobacter rodentium]